MNDNLKTYSVSLQCTTHATFDVTATNPQDAEKTALDWLKNGKWGTFEHYNAYATDIQEKIQEKLQDRRPFSGYIIIRKDGKPVCFASDNAIVVYGDIQTAQEDFDPEFDDRIEPYTEVLN